jgi:hypothetical protein
MQKMRIFSVFDIIRLPKAVFVRRVSKYSDTDAGLAYDNAMSFAVQLGRLFREYQTSSGQLSAGERRAGIRSLVDMGATYQNLFSENWDQFCAEGAMAAIDSPPAYLSRLYNFVAEIEQLTAPDEGKPDNRALLEKRRPDLKDMIIDKHSTFTPVPMLDIVIETLSKSVRQYLDTTPDKDKSLYEVMAARRYPFTFPYNLHHQQCLLGLADKKLLPGELNYRISQTLPLSQQADNQFGAGSGTSTDAQCLLSGLSPQQQQLLIEPPLFTTFYVGRDELNQGWKGPNTSAILPLNFWRLAYFVPAAQPAITSVTPPAEVTSIPYTGTNVALTQFSKTGVSDLPVSLNLNSTNTLIPTNLWLVNHLHAASPEPRVGLSIKAAATLPTDKEGYSASFYIVTAPHDPTGMTQLAAVRQSFTLTLDAAYHFTEAQQGFFQQSFGVQAYSPHVSPLTELPTFQHHTGLNGEQAEMLLSRRTYSVRLSPNVLSTNEKQSGTPVPPPNGEKVLPYPHPSHYGARYVNGAGSDNYDSLDEPTAASIQMDKYDNDMDLVQRSIGGATTWHITKTSPDRLDRLQRMVRLQAWFKIPFQQLDTLVSSVMRAEGLNNPELALNTNTLRALGVYQYLNNKYGIEAEPFAAFFHDLAPYSSGKKDSLFDQVFNHVKLFDRLLTLDQTAFTVDNPDAAAQKTLLQLCAGLGLEPTEDSLLLLVRQTLKDWKVLKRDLQTVSSVYRQARIARLFGLSVSDTLGLAHLLGGDAYRTSLSTGQLAPRIGDTSTTPDVLDVLMQMDWAVGWLKDCQQSVAQVRHLLGLDIDATLLSPELLSHLVTFLQATPASVVTAQALHALDLPTHEDPAVHKAVPGPAIDWFKVLLDEKGAPTKEPLIDARGLVVELPLEDANDPLEPLNKRLTVVVGRLKLEAPGLKAHVVDTLLHFVAKALDRQSSLVSSLLHDTQKLPKERTLAVLAWAGTSVCKLLNEALNAGDAPTEALTTLYLKLARHALACQQLRISNSALTLFQLNNAWLGSSDYADATTQPSLAQLYLLERFGHWHRNQSQSEDVLLGYFNLANPTAERLKNNALRQVASENANTALARLLNWDVKQVTALTATLTHKRATTMGQVDWVLRCQAVSHSSGLATEELLHTTSVTAQSAFDDWKRAGEAIIAASYPVDDTHAAIED